MSEMWIFVPGLYTRLWQNTINMPLAVYEYIVGPHQHSGHRFIRGGEGREFYVSLGQQKPESTYCPILTEFPQFVSDIIASISRKT